jgi:hypothetical protein
MKSIFNIGRFGKYKEKNISVLIKKEGKMKKGILAFSLLVVVLFTFSVAVWAEEVKKPVAVTVDDIKKMLGLSIYLQGGYTYNFESPDSQENDFRVFDHKANSFTLDLAELVFTREAPVGGVGYRLKLSAGETAKFIHSAGLGNSDQPFDITEAYIDYVAPLGSGLKLRFGKFATYIGAEVIEARDNFNYSRSFLFNYAIPFTHTGLMAGYTFSDRLSAAAYLVNGWDNSSDEGQSKSLGASVSVTPISPVSLIFNVINGREADAVTGTEPNRFVFDWIGTVKAAENLTFMVNTDYGVEDSALADGKDAKWYGIAGYAKYDFTKLFSLSGRAEYFRDGQGVRTGTPQALKEVTITPEVHATDNLIVRPEYRHDWSNVKSFDSNNKKSQDTIAFAVMYTW